MADSFHFGARRAADLEITPFGLLRVAVGVNRFDSRSYEEGRGGGERFSGSAASGSAM